MSKRWYQENKRDPWRREAKSKGYRARSAYKLLQIQERFRIIKKGNNILDIGCHPGGWTQVSVELVEDDGLVIGVDIGFLLHTMLRRTLVSDLSYVNSLV